jgi:catechol 2,3-dioxygenase-like lactoylglutathione lyase family enzyme
MQKLRGVDHLVLVAGDVERTVGFYADVLGGTVRNLAAFRAGSALYPSVHFDNWKINVHPVATPAEPRAHYPRPGTADFCLRFDGPVSDAIAQLTRHDVAIELGPTAQECAAGWATSVYFRDPDGCLVELACYRGGNP